MSKFKEIEKKLHETIDKVTKGEIDLKEASVIFKGADSLTKYYLGSMKYAEMTKAIPFIPFYEEAKVIDIEKQKFLEETKKLT